MKNGTLAGEAVDMGCFCERMAGAAELVEAEVVHEDEDDVGPGSSLGQRDG